MTEPQPLCVYEKRDPHIAIIRLNRPEKKNAISRDLYWALDECWQKAKDRRRCLVDYSDRNSRRFLRRRRFERESRLRQRRNERTQVRAQRIFQPAPAADAQTDHRCDQRLRRRRRIQPRAVVPHPLLRAGIEIRLLGSALVAHGGMAELCLPTADRMGAIGSLSAAR